MFAGTRKGVPRRSEAGKSASYPSRGSCRSGSWMPKESRIASTSGWYSKIILRKPCRNGIAAAAPSTEAETPTGVRRAARGPNQVRPLAGSSPQSPAPRPARCTAQPGTTRRKSPARFRPAQARGRERGGGDSALCGFGGSRCDWARTLGGVLAGPPHGTRGCGPAAKPDPSPRPASPVPGPAWLRLAIPPAATGRRPSSAH